MKILDRLFGRKAAQLTYDQVAALIDGGTSASVAGVHVTARSALQVATVLDCVRVIADGCATPHLHIYREKSDGTNERAMNIPEYRLLFAPPERVANLFRVAPANDTACRSDLAQACRSRCAAITGASVS